MDWRSANYFLLNGDLSADELKVVVKNFKGFLKSYKAEGLNTVSLTWSNPVDPSTGKILNKYGKDVPDYLESVPTAHVLRTLTDVAHNKGFKVIWKPHFITNEADAGNVNPFYVNANFDVNAFLSNVKALEESRAGSRASPCESAYSWHRTRGVCGAGA